MSPKQRILAYLERFLREPALAKVGSFEDEVFASARQSLEIIALDLPGQVNRYCDRLSFWKRLVATDYEELLDRQTSISRTMMYGYLFRSLLGRQLDSVPMANLFAGTEPDARGILESTDPEVMKLREHLGVAMVIFELVGKHALLPTKQALENPTGNLQETLARAKVMHRLRLDGAEELFNFRRSAADWQ
ncbi:MAG: hypothetical protein Q8Q05_00090 [bacterium]|nr:hypothetical protein [bacterium]